ncbi:dethiobiotin synthase [Parazoarcus communis]|uniref:ATP-dependent dethiobiotin synthetase BioD n=1 Tax=Parazoarcus communis TaxID=41977 RepID=A0A2U8GNQ8_9RHOO|nr:dethiobiotin synthase [Parazoarcus communis]AWI74596.1 dethiobiotin synthase [Parazoarcus communis]
MNESRAWFVAGTDTGIGKTFATAALIHAARKQGHRTLGMKPIAAGAELVGSERINEDAALLRAAGSFDPGLGLINPYCLMAPIAPHIAAAEEGVSIEPGRVIDCFNTLSAAADRIFVEGVGGFRVPLGPAYDTADLASDLGLPVILVVGLRLGCISHSLLTIDAILGRGLSLAGWVANCIDPTMLRREGNIDSLRTRIDAPLLARLPFVEGGDASSVSHLCTLPG